MRHLEGADKLHTAKVFGALRDDARNLLGQLQVHLMKEDRSCKGGGGSVFLNPDVGKVGHLLTCSHSERLLVAAVQALVLPCLSNRA